MSLIIFSVIIAVNFICPPQEKTEDAPVASAPDISP
jgi:hypothetical protein